MTACDILVTEDLQSPEIDRLEKQFSVRRCPSLWNDPSGLSDAIRNARCVMIRNQTRITRELLEAAPNLIAIGRVGVGLDNIDMDAARARAVVVIAPLEANAVSVAEFTVGLMIALARKIPQADRSTKTGGWDRRGCTGMELHGKTLLICGLGRIGRLVAQRAAAFGIRVLAFDPFVKEAAGVVLIPDLTEALPQADFVSAHLPLTPKTQNLFNASTFAAFKPGAFFINTSRGGIVDETALETALRGGHLAGAALDVRQTEPPTAPDPFRAFENVILTPHIGSFTLEAQSRTFAAVCTDLQRILTGQPPLNSV